MDFAAIERLKEAAEAIHVPAIDKSRSGDSERAAARKAVRRREFATLMRSIKSLVRDGA